MTAAPKRRWFRFSLRTVFVVVTLVAVGIAWMQSQVKTVRERERLIKTSIFWGVSSQHPPRIPWVWSLLGAKPVNAIGLDKDKFSEVDVLRYKVAFPEADVMLGSRDDFKPDKTMAKYRASRRDEVDPKAWAGPRTTPLNSPTH
jgi:hypothetical protein